MNSTTQLGKLLEKARKDAQRPKPEETNTNGAEQAMMASNFLITANSVNDGLKLIPSFLYPDNPAQKHLLGFIDVSKWIPKLTALSPLFLIPLWFNFFHSAKCFYEADNKNWERYMDLGVSTLSAVGWTILYVVGMGVVGGLLLKVAPYLLATLLAVKAVAGVVNCIKNLYYAYKAENSEERDQYLWNAAKQLVSVATYTLGFVLSLFLGIDMNQAGELINTNFFAGIKAVGALFDKSIPVIYGLMCSTLLGAAMDMKETNEQTWHAIKNPWETLTKAWNKFISNPLNIVPMVLNVVTHTIALAFAPLQLLVIGLKKGVTAALPVKLPQLVVEKSAKEESSDLKHDLQMQIRKNSGNTPTDQRKAKTFLAQMMLASIDSSTSIPKINGIDSLEITQAVQSKNVERMAELCKKHISNDLNSSLFSRKSNTLVLQEKFKKYRTQEVSAAKPAI
jgi:hypothetical protein